MSSIRTFENRMKAAIGRAAYAMEMTDDLEKENKILAAMYRELLDNGSYYIEDRTGAKDALNGSFDAIRDDLDDAFDKAIAAKEQAAEEAQDEWLRDASRADRLHDERRDQEAMEAAQ